jgi:hypothetical protein
VQIFCVRRAASVDKAVLVFGQPDCVDDEFAVLVMADRFAEPGGLHIGAVLAVEKDPPHEVISLPDNPDFVGHLDEVDRLGKEEELSRNPAGPAA